MTDELSQLTGTDWPEGWSPEKWQEMEKEGGDKKKETPAELKQKAKDQYAPFVNESVNVLADMVMPGVTQAAPQALRAGAGGMSGR